MTLNGKKRHTTVAPQMVEDDMAPFDVEDVHPEVRAAMRQAGFEISEPERYKDDASEAGGGKKWWKF